MLAYKIRLSARVGTRLRQRISAVFRPPRFQVLATGARNVFTHMHTIQYTYPLANDKQNKKLVLVLTLY